MSDIILKLIPTNPNFVPSSEKIKEAEALMKLIATTSNKITSITFDGIQFVDPGENLEKVLCPNCNKNIIQWWSKQAMDSKYDPHVKQFTDLVITTPCCNSTFSLNDLVYEWQAGFARFSLESLNPGVKSISHEQFVGLEKTLGTKLRIIWAKY